MSKIKFKIIVSDRFLAFFIVEIDDRARCSKKYIAKNGIEIKSTDSPSISSVGTVYITGTYDYDDNRISILGFESHDDAVGYKKKIVDALEEWSEKAPCFKKEKNVDSYNSCAEYEF